MGVSSEDTRNLNYNPYSPLYSHSFHFIFHCPLHVVLHYNGRILGILTIVDVERSTCFIFFHSLWACALRSEV